MKKSKIIIMAIATVVSQLLGVQSGGAQGFYDAFVDAVSISTNQDGNLTYQRFNNQSIINSVASQQGITNPCDLSLVYDQTADALDVVSVTNDTNYTVVSTVLTFSDGVSLSNTNGTEILRLAGVYWETNDTINGTLFAKELIPPVTEVKPLDGHGSKKCRQQGGDTEWEPQTEGFSLQGQLQFMMPTNGTNASVIYVGSLSAGSSSCGRH